MRRCYPYHSCTRCGCNLAADPSITRQDRIRCECDCNEYNEITGGHAENCSLARCFAPRPDHCKWFYRRSALPPLSFWSAQLRWSKCQSPASSRCQAEILQ